MQETVTIGCPVRNREEYLPYYLDCILKLDYPKELITLLFVENDSKDKTYQLLEQFKSKHNNEYFRIRLHQVNQGTPPDARITEIREKYTYKALSNLRNFWMSKVRTDYALSVDSDIMIEPETLIRLLSWKKHYISGMIINGYQYFKDDHPERCTNILMKKEDYYVHITNPAQRLIEVDVSGALFLVSKEAVKAGKFIWHKQGEDCSYCASLQKAGFKLYCDTDVKATHCMTLDYLNRYIRGEFKYSG